MAIKIKTIRESVQSTGLKVLVHGLAGSGKTVMCGTAGSRTLLISAEGGLLALKGAIDNGLLPESVNELVDVIEINNLEDLLEAYEFAKTSAAKEYEWVMLDSISEIAEVVLENEKEHSKDPRMAYGNLITEMQAILRKFRDLQNKNVLFTCKQQRIVDADTEKTMYVPSMPGSKLHQAIPYMFDEVFALRVEKDEDGEDYRVLQTNRDIRYEAKDRSGKLEMWEEPVLFNILKKINAGKKDIVFHTELKYYFVEESGDVFDSMDDKTENEELMELAVEISEEKYNELIGEGQEVEEVEEVEEEAEEAEEAEESPEIIADKAMYWLHKPTGKLAETEKGDDISDFVDNEEIERITKVKYTKLNK